MTAAISADPVSGGAATDRPQGQLPGSSYLEDGYTVWS
ncbi:MAG: hypothetical protein JWP52_2721, partial [Rhizobacter sp.]|nr:hypothetical protein [Rhizobacter sp.]